MIYLKVLESSLTFSKNYTLNIFAYSESKLTCHFVVVLLVVVLLVVVVGGKRSEKVGKRSKKVTYS